MLDDESEEREDLYARAERVAAALASTGDELRDLIADVNEGASQTRPSHCATVPALQTGNPCMQLTRSPRRVCHPLL